MRPAIVVVGSANMDMVVKLIRSPRPGETVFGRTFGMFPGGKGANQAVCAAKLGARTTFIGKVGPDVLGRRLKETMRQAGVQLTHLMTDPAASTGTAMISVDASGENQIIVVSGANMQITPADIRKHRRAFSGARVVLSQLEIPLESVRETLRAAKEAGCTVVLNPAPARPLPRSILRNVDYLTPNETEAEILTGVAVRDLATAERAARRLIGLGVGTVIVTLGKRGCFMVCAGGKLHVPALKVKAVDTTAAGDAFNGSLALALARGKSPAEAMCFASSVAAFSVTRMGAQVSMPWPKELRAFVRKEP